MNPEWIHRRGQEKLEGVIVDWKNPFPVWKMPGREEEMECSSSILLAEATSTPGAFTITYIVVQSKKSKYLYRLAVLTY